MIIHVVRPGDTINNIAQMYNVSPQKIMSDNEITDPTRLVVGQTLVILIPNQIHTVQQGETLVEIARRYNTTTVQLLQYNPYLSAGHVLQPGDQIVISYNEEKVGTIHINGYVYPFVDRETLIKTLPYLTYLSIFTYGFTPEGELIDIEDEEIIRLARDYGVAPLMVLAPMTEEEAFSNELASIMLNNPAVQNNLIENILEVLRAKNYYGVDVDFEFILAEDRDAFSQFVSNLTSRLNAEGFEVFVALAPKTSADQAGLLYEAHDYSALGQAANNVLIMTYEWGYTYGPPMAVAPINLVRGVLDYAVTEIPRDKMFMGIPNYAYDFLLPFVRGVSRANSISNTRAVELAYDVGARIQFDELAQTPFYIYYDNLGRRHEVWFEDARSIKAKLDTFSEYDLKGVSYWHLMNYFPQNWLIVAALYNVAKVL